MKALKTTRAIFIAILLGLFTFSVNAQEGQGNGQKQRKELTEDDINKKVERLSEKLLLSEEQKAEILAFELIEYNSMKTARVEFADDHDGMKNHKRISRANRDKEYNETLTAEQFVKWEELKAQRKLKHQQKKSEQNANAEQNRGRGN